MIENPKADPTPIIKFTGGRMESLAKFAEAQIRFNDERDKDLQHMESAVLPASGVAPIQQSKLGSVSKVGSSEFNPSQPPCPEMGLIQDPLYPLRMGLVW